MKKKPIEIDDFNSLSKLSLAMAETLYARFTPTDSESFTTFQLNQKFPLRWNILHSGHLFEWVVSEMGSITLRLGAPIGIKKSKPPIFYLSLGKYEEEGFLWEDPNGDPIKNIQEQLEILILDKINIYCESMKELL